MLLPRVARKILARCAGRRRQRALRARGAGARACAEPRAAAVAMLATASRGSRFFCAAGLGAEDVPAWVRARGLAAFVVVFMGGMAFGSICLGTGRGAHRHPGRAHGRGHRNGRSPLCLTWRFKLGDRRCSTSPRRWTGRHLCSPSDPGPTADRCMVTIEYRSNPTARRIRRGDAVGARDASAKRRILLGALPRLGRSQPLPSSVSWTNPGSSICASMNGQASPTAKYSNARINTWSRERTPGRRTGWPTPKGQDLTYAAMPQP